MRNKRVIGVLIVISIIVAGFLLYASSDSDKEYKPVQIDGKSKEELKNELNRISKEIISIKEIQTSLQQKLNKAKIDKKEVDELSDNIDKCKDNIMKIQKEALYIGKFICKVNTCQTNPEDENYSVFLSITKDLENAKQELFEAQDAYDEANASVSNISSYESKITQNKELLQLFTTDKERIETALKK